VLNRFTSTKSYKEEIGTSIGGKGVRGSLCFTKSGPLETPEENTIHSPNRSRLPLCYPVDLSLQVTFAIELTRTHSDHVFIAKFSPFVLNRRR